ncbi:MAG: hypothetical protein ACI9UT_001092 [Flavobacteriales bacterium]|jgi:hypothetical protein
MGHLKYYASCLQLIIKPQRLTTLEARLCLNVMFKKTLLKNTPPLLLWQVLSISLGLVEIFTLSSC